MSPPSLRQTPVDLVGWLIDGGVKLSNKDAKQILLYFRRMVYCERIVLITEEQQIVAFCTFFLVWDMKDTAILHHRKIWELPLIGYGLGTIGYIDKIAARMPWTKSLRKKVEAVILDRYPMVETWVWYRPSRHDEPDHRIVRSVSKEVVNGSAV